MSLLLDALQRASDEKEKLAEEQALKDKSAQIREPSERTSFPDLVMDSGRVEPSLTALQNLPDAQPESNAIKFETPDFLDQSNPSVDAEKNTADAGSVSNPVSADKILGRENVVVEKSSQASPAFALTPMSEPTQKSSVVAPAPVPDAVTVLDKPVLKQAAIDETRDGLIATPESELEKKGQAAQAATPRYQPTAAPQIARDIVAATAKPVPQRPSRRVVWLGASALVLLTAVAAVIFFPRIFDQSPPPTVAAFNPSAPAAPTAMQAVSEKPAPIVDTGVAQADSGAAPALSGADANSSAPVAASVKNASSSGLANQDTVRTAVADANSANNYAAESRPRSSTKRESGRQGKPVFVAAPTAATNLDRGYVALTEGRFDDAINNYQMALKKNPGEIDALLGLAYIAQRQNRNDEARADYLSVLRQIPNHPGANAGLLSLPSSVDAQVAGSRAREVAEHNPNSAVAFAALGNTLAKEGRIAEAQQAYFRAVTLDPANALYTYNLAVALDRLHKNTAAAQYYGDAIRLAGNAADSEHAGFPRAVALQRLEQLRAGAATVQVGEGASVSTGQDSVSGNATKTAGQSPTAIVSPSK